MAMSSIRKQKFKDQLPCEIFKIMKTKFKWPTNICDFISAKFVIGYPCLIHYILFYNHGPFFYVNITKLLKLKMAAKRPFLNCFLPKVSQVIC